MKRKFINHIFILLLFILFAPTFHKPTFIITEFYNYHYIQPQLYKPTKIQNHIYNTHFYKSPPINIPTPTNPRAARYLNR